MRLPADGRWKGMGPSRDFADKFWVWRRGYDPRSENRPAERMHIDEATNAFGPGWSRMLAGMEFPSAGCWQVTANYRYAGITQELTFVVDVIGE